MKNYIYTILLLSILTNLSFAQKDTTASQGYFQVSLCGTIPSNYNQNKIPYSLQHDPSRAYYISSWTNLLGGDISLEYVKPVFFNGFSLIGGLDISLYSYKSSFGDFYALSLRERRTGINTVYDDFPVNSFVYNTTISFLVGMQYRFFKKHVVSASFIPSFFYHLNIYKYENGDGTNSTETFSKFLSPGLAVMVFRFSYHYLFTNSIKAQMFIQAGPRAAYSGLGIGYLFNQKKR